MSPKSISNEVPQILLLPIGIGILMIHYFHN